MKRFYSSLFVSVFVLSACTTTSGGGTNARTEMDMYMCSVKSETAHDVYIISLQRGTDKGMYSHTHDRYKENSSALMHMEFGTFERVGDNVTFTSKEKDPYTGAFTGKGLEVEGRVYVLTEKDQK